MEQRAEAQRDVRVVGPGLDVSALPSFGFSHRSLMWWGTLCLMGMEGTVFALGVASYFFLRTHVATWPMSAPAPGLTWGTANTVLLLASIVPNHLAKRAAERLDLRGVRIWVGICLLMAFVFLALRVLEYKTLNVRWDSNAYGSVVWMLISLHTVHLITDTWDTSVLVALSFTQRFENKRFVDVSENALYWYFVVYSWVPIYAVIYVTPQLP